MIRDFQLHWNIQAQVLVRSSSFRVYVKVVKLLLLTFEYSRVQGVCNMGWCFWRIFPLTWRCWGRYTGFTLAKWAITITIGLLVGIELPTALCEIWVQIIFVKVPVNSFRISLIFYLYTVTKCLICCGNSVGYDIWGCWTFVCCLRSKWSRILCLANIVV